MIGFVQAHWHMLGIAVAISVMAIVKFSQSRPLPSPAGDTEGVAEQGPKKKSWIDRMTSSWAWAKLFKEKFIFLVLAVALAFCIINAFAYIAKDNNLVPGLIITVCMLAFFGFLAVRFYLGINAVMLMGFLKWSLGLSFCAIATTVLLWLFLGIDLVDAMATKVATPTTVSAGSTAQASAHGSANKWRTAIIYPTAQASVDMVLLDQCLLAMVTEDFYFHYRSQHQIQVAIHLDGYDGQLDLVTHEAMARGSKEVYIPVTGVVSDGMNVFVFSGIEDSIEITYWVEPM